ncbi:MAG: FAD-dependent oxidoreductase [Opitutales bacterium]|nr:FAD-dependent oxidoreductase [Opitutales bacterium]
MIPTPSRNGRVRIPVFAAVDILVVGADSAAAACALEGNRCGLNTLAVSDRAYFGTESAGALRLETSGFAGADPILAAVRAGAKDSCPPYPGAVKRILEEQLLAAGVPYLYYARPVAPLRGADGSLRGLVFASRTALFAVRARIVVDATEHALAAVAAGGPAPAPPARQEWTVLTARPPESRGPWCDAGTRFTLPGKKADETNTQQVWRAEFAGPSADAPLRARAAAEFHLRAGHAFSGIGLSADAMAPLRPAGPDHAPPGVILCRPAAAGGPPTAAARVAAGRRCAAEAAARLGSAGRRAESDAVGTGTTADARASFAPTFVRPSRCRGWIDIDFPKLPLLAEFDVAVAGGGTGGASAGIAAGRAGARTVVLETQYALGGVGTAGLIARYWFGNRVGFTAEIDREVTAYSGEAAPGSKGTEWNPEDKSHWLMRTLRAAGGEAWLGSFAFGVRADGGHVESLLVSTPFGMGRVDCASVVDATGNADIAAAAGAPCRVVGADHTAVQGAGLSPRNPNRGYRNTDHSFIDDCDIEGVTHAFTTTRAKFADEFDVSNLVDSRERRQIRSDLELSPLDFLADRTFPDTVVTAESNFDTHGFTVHPVFQIVPPHKKPLRVHVPYRCMLPVGIDNVVTTGLGMGAHRDALPVVRMQADVQNQGYAAGLACVRALRDGTTPRAVDIRAVQRDLTAAGVIADGVAEHTDSFPLPDTAITQAVDTGPVDLLSCAILVGNAERALPGILERWEAPRDEDDRLRLALLLGFLGRPEPAAYLADRIDKHDWDDGWNYTGMGQFGRSSSSLDDALLALAGTGEAEAMRGPLVRKITALGADAAFSHCRAVATAAAVAAPSPEVGAALARLLSLPGVGGHAWTAARDALKAIDPDPNETRPRNLALREITLARGLFLCGDAEGLGRKALEAYANDIRGQLARHAQAVLGINP